MKLIKDLGSVSVGNIGRKERHGLYECPACFGLFERCISRVKLTKQKQCRSCSSKEIGCKTKHGMTGKKIFIVWRNMNDRCSNENSVRYHRYGGRGITVCDEWLNIENFCRDMGDQPEGMELDRINNNGNYEPSNCRWVTPMENVRNSTITKLDVDKVSVIKRLLLDKNYAQKSLAMLFNVTRSTIHRIKTGKSWADVSPYQYPLINTQFNRKQEV